MKNLPYILILLVVGWMPGYGQNNGIFGGGSDDGYTLTRISIDQNNNIFGGGTDDGYTVTYQTQPINSRIFGGGVDDGYALNRYVQSQNNNIFGGGIDDGYDNAPFSIPINNDIFGGGIDDGYDNISISQPINNGIFGGGVDDGYTVFTIVGLPDRFPNPFPIELLSFDAWPVDQQVNIQWVTTHEVNLEKFIVERSQDGLTFESLTEVKGKGGPQVTQPYETVDSDPYVGVSYYRLTSVDLDGKEELSRIVEVHFDQEQGIMLTAFPNPTRDILNLRISSAQRGIIELAVYDLAGRQVPIPVQVLELSGSLETQIDMGILTEGIYVLRLSSLELGLQKVIKVRKI